MPQFCDQTCSWCAREFWKFYKGRMKAFARESGRSGDGSFAVAAATSINKHTVSDLAVAGAATR